MLAELEEIGEKAADNERATGERKDEERAPR
jgi:hypothetical protein